MTKPVNKLHFIVDSSEDLKGIEVIQRILGFKGEVSERPLFGDDLYPALVVIEGPDVPLVQVARWFIDALVKGSNGVVSERLLLPF